MTQMLLDFEVSSSAQTPTVPAHGRSRKKITPREDSVCRKVAHVFYRHLRNPGIYGWLRCIYRAATELAQEGKAIDEETLRQATNDMILKGGIRFRKIHANSIRAFLRLQGYNVPENFEVNIPTDQALTKAALLV